MALPENLTVLDDHPIIRTRITQIRDHRTDQARFRAALHDIGRLMAYQLTARLETTEIEVETPLTKTVGHQLSRPIVIVPILRAGVGLLQGFVEILSEASVGYIGLARDEATHQPERYYFKQPKGLINSEIIVVDPMLATGGSAIAALSELKAAGATRLQFAAAISAPEGVLELSKAHPDVPIFTAACDERLNENAYIFPGLGDAGDRYCGTV